MRYGRGWLVAGLAAAVAGCLPTRPEAPATPDRYHGRLAIHAALMAAPHPPRDVWEMHYALQRLEAVSPDEDRDGALEFDEWVEQYFAIMLLFNTSHDGRLKLDDYIAFKNINRSNTNDPELRIFDEREFELLDHNHHDFVTADDLRDSSYGSFQMNDLNHDGRVADAEIHQVAESDVTSHLFP